MASYNDTASETSSSSVSESETKIGLIDENGKKISVQGEKISKCKLILRSGVSLIQCLNVTNDIVFSIMQLSFAWCILNNSETELYNYQWWEKSLKNILPLSWRLSK